LSVKSKKIKEAAITLSDGITT